MNTRRDLIRMGVALAAAAPQIARAQARKPLLIGVGSSAHQVEGGNVNNDLWLQEHALPQSSPDKSGDACDHYNLYASDIALFARLGFKGYRFSVEWSRVEPERGEFSQAQLDHYKRVAALCRENGIAPLITLHHFASPLWLARNGGWEKAEAADLFARYTQRVAANMGELPLGYCTINEMNVPPFRKRRASRNPALAQAVEAMRKYSGAAEFSTFLLGDVDRMMENLVAAHTKCVAAAHAENGRALCGMTLAMRDHQPVPGGEANFRAIEQSDYLPFLELARKDDFVGVQSYTRFRVGAQGELNPDDSAEKTESGSEYYPQALEDTVRYAAAKAGRPIIVTENGVPTSDDRQRIRFIDTALAGLRRCMADGIDVRGYFHWSALDSFEFTNGYRHHYGLIAVDRKTMARTPKQSAEHLGRLAQAG